MCSCIDSFSRAIHDLAEPKALWQKVSHDIPLAEENWGRSLGALTTCALGILAAALTVATTVCAVVLLVSGAIPLALAALGMAIFLTIAAASLYVATDYLANAALQRQRDLGMILDNPIVQE